MLFSNNLRLLGITIIGMALPWLGFRQVHIRLLVFVCAFSFMAGISLCAPKHSKNVQVTPQTPVDATVCQIAQSPESFDHQLVRVHGYISYGFEDFGLHDPACPEESLVNMRALSASPPRIWVDFGEDAQYYKLKNYAPLVKDDQLASLQKVLKERSHNRQMTGATVLGTLFAPKKIKVNGRNAAWGYGHMSCCSLFVISRVEFVETDYSDSLNYSWADWDVGLPQGCSCEQSLGVPTNATLLAWQAAANQGQDAWLFDAKSTAEDELRKLKSGAFGRISGGTPSLLVPSMGDLSTPQDTRPTEMLLETSSAPYLKRFEWIEPDLTTRNVIVVSRPYWLLKTAGAPEKVIWAPVGASVLDCRTPQVGKKRKH